MSNREGLRRHAELVDQMATKLGVDLQHAAIGGAVSVDEITDAVLRCTGCTNPNHCENILASAASAGLPPEYCKNLDLLKRLTP